MKGFLIRLFCAVAVAAVVLQGTAASACDGACCACPSPELRVMGFIDAGFLLTAIGYTCEEIAESETLDEGWEPIRRIAETQFVGVLREDGFRPRFFAAKLDAVRAYRPEELLFLWRRAMREEDAAQSKAMTVSQFEADTSAVALKERAGRQHVFDRAGNLLVSYGDEQMFVTTALGAFSTSGQPYFAVDVMQKSSVGNYPERFRTIDFMALPSSLDIVVYDGLGAKADAKLRSALQNALERIKSAGFRRVALKRASRVHERSKLLHRGANRSETTPFRSLGGPVLLRDYFGPGVRVLLKAAGGLGREQECVDACVNVMSREELNWDEKAHIILIVGLDWGEVLASLEKSRAYSGEVDQAFRSKPITCSG